MKKWLSVKIGMTRLSRLLDSAIWILGAVLYIAILTGDYWGLNVLVRPLIAILGLLLIARHWERIRVPVERQREHLWLGLILIAAFAVRAYGANFGLPYLDHPDEQPIVDRALNIMLSGDFNPHWFKWPTLYIYIQSIVGIAHFLYGVLSGLYTSLPTSLGAMRQPGFYMWGRITTAIFGTATVYLTYEIGRKLYDSTTGLLASLFLAFSYLHVEESHFITPDVPMAFFTTLAFATSCLLLQRNARILYILSGLSIGLAMATKYNGFLIVVPLILAHLFTPGERILSSNIFIGLAFIMAGFLIGCPYSMLDLPTFLDELAFDIYHYKFLGHPPYEGINNWLHYSRYLFSTGLGGPLALAALGGIIICFISHKKKDILLMSFPLLYFAFLSSYKVNFVRNLMPLLPFLAVFAAHCVTTIVYGLLSRTTYLQRREGLMLLAIGLFLIYSPLRQIVKEDYLMAQKTTRVIATEWLEEHLPPGSRVWIEALLIDLSDEFEVHIPGWSPSNPDITARSFEWYEQLGFDYVVVSSATLSFPPDSLMKEFVGNKIDTPGPDIRVFQIPKQPLPIQLARYELDRKSYQPGDTLHLTLWWKALGKLQEDFTIFAHLLSHNGDMVAQKDSPPQRGDYPTTEWTPGEVIEDQREMFIPAEAPPGKYKLEIGMYWAQDMRCLPFLDMNANPTEGLILAPVKVVTAEALIASEALSVQYPHRINLANKVTFLGYDLNREVLMAGETLRLTLYWQAQRRMDEDYTVFVHLLDREGQIQAQRDNQPLDGAYPTSIWDKGEIVKDEYELSIPPDVSPGDYQVEVGMYLLSTMERLKVLTEDGEAEGDRILLTEVHVR